VPIALTDLTRLLAAANLDPGLDGEQARATIRARFASDQRLAVYGSLAPGKPNHHLLAPLGGKWTDGVVEGDLVAVGWGAAIGFPALRPRPGGPPVAVKVLTSPLLETAWAALDRFEGPGYRRVLVPVLALAAVRRLDGEPPSYDVAQLYAAREPLEADR
jgi:gamma-glutamylcyclotransferase (GGCT)/AIG2-like uncharacterized protein YtfP